MDNEKLTTTIEFTLEAKEMPDEILDDLQRLLRELKGKYKIIGMRLQAGIPANDVIQNTGDVANLATLRLYFDRIKLQTEAWKSGRDPHRPSYRAGIPPLEESFFISVLENLNCIEARLLLEHNKGVTRKVLKRAMEVTCMPRSPWTGDNAQNRLLKIIMGHLFFDEELLWIAVKSPLASIRMRIIPRANAQMVRYLEETPEFQPLSKSFKDILEIRKRKLGLLSSEFQSH